MATAPGEIRTIDPVQGHEHTHTVILLHGRDSSGNDFAAEFFESEISQDLAKVLAQQCPGQADDIPPPRTLQDLFPTFKRVFPSASAIPSQRFGTPLTQWFDMWSTDNPGEKPELQEPGLCQSIDFISRLIDQESRFLSREKVILGGISQGSAAAVAAFLSSCEGLGGLFGFSSWAYPELSPYGVLDPNGKARCGKYHCIQHEKPKLGYIITKEITLTPIFLAHALDDDVVPVENGRIIYAALRNMGAVNVEWHEYQYGGHWITEPEGVDDLVRFLKRNLNTPKEGLS
ncbi:phospholipase/Carboxylesterase [Colletotrichum orchidophilum]|uniref:Phospholipase/Carboxylesterase n=1 Tax=Colletotrichum orchidophilum TaxID=1209926 RepID=A0A1G4BB34_9PEZI|nr:phospholipase/Carboxylesterase [Colletotrichum orchidophilum]OHE98621.1 phospholipase/Carboxylesterase [Colletotrichum orchidophilum]